ncbi:MAG TPA: hypothetical protein VLF43_04920 [Candidatus Saccharimonadales bacterium]|nr:hypothetical protein [Candidatus Saccharimonadales bacterium]
MHTAEVVPHTANMDTSTEGAREAVLRKLLPLDYDYAKQSGLIDMFTYDPERGEDGLLHTLAGNLRTGKDGGVIPGGYHHEASADAAWPAVKNEQTGEAQPSTYVDRSHMKGANSDRRRRYKEWPLEPYATQVVLNGLVKYEERQDPNTGAIVAAPARNAMFPKEYDALAVMQTIRSAMENRDPVNDRKSVSDIGEQVLVNDSGALLMDGKTVMPVRLVMDGDGKRVKTAMPILPRKPGFMKLDPEQAQQHVVSGQW